MNDGLEKLQTRLQHRFSNPALLQRALTHRSFSITHYERLEFLGDSVLGLAISDLLFARLSSLPEGDLSRIRSNLVRQETLHEIALTLDLPKVIRLGEGELQSGGLKRPSILADTLEALIGAVYLDAGFGVAKNLVERLFQSIEINPQMKAIGKDAKTELQEWLQQRKKKLPSYKIVDITGAAHEQSFHVECEIPELQLCARGQGHSRRAGEQAAAATMLQTIKSKFKNNAK